jgi:hypothetical protein
MNARTVEMCGTKRKNSLPLSPGLELSLVEIALKIRREGIHIFGIEIDCLSTCVEAGINLYGALPLVQTFRKPESY